MAEPPLLHLKVQIGRGRSVCGKEYPIHHAHVTQRSDMASRPDGHVEWNWGIFRPCEECWTRCAPEQAP